MTEIPDHSGGDSPSPSSGFAGWVTLALFLVALVLTRFIDLGRQAPWNDEVNNWIWALQYPLGLTPPHKLTYATQSIFLSISDSIYMLRLPGALLMSLSGLIVFGWLWRALGVGAAGVFAFLFTFSPMAIFYSQDANHYGYMCLSGALGLLGAWRWWSSEPRGATRWGSAILIAAILAGLYRAHMFAAFALGALGVAVAADLLRRPEQIIFLKKLPAQKGRLVVGGVLAIVAIFVALMAHEVATRSEHPELAGVVYFSANPAFMLRLFANFFGAYLFEGPLDYLLGFAGLVVSVAGWVLYVKRVPAALGPALFMVSFLGAIIVFFTMYEFYHSFHVRYIIALLPGLLVGVAVAAALPAEALWEARQSGKSLKLQLRFIGGGAALVLALFLLRAAPWAGAYYGGNFQPTIPAMEYIAENTPREAIIGTRSTYIASALRFLNERLPAEQQREYIWLGEAPPSSQNAAGLARALGITHPDRFFMLDMARLGETNHADYARFLAEETETIAVFNSATPQDFTGDDRSLILRKPVASELALPIPGHLAAAFAPLEMQPYMPRQSAPPLLWIRSGMSVVFLLPAGAGNAAYINAAVDVPEGETEWLVGRCGDGAEYFAWKLEGTGARALKLSAFESEEPVWLQLNFALSQQARPEVFPTLTLVEIAETPVEGAPVLSSSEIQLRNVPEAAQSLLPGPSREGLLEMRKADGFAELPIFTIFAYDAQGITPGIVNTRIEWADDAGNKAVIPRAQWGTNTMHTIRPMIFGYVFDRELPATIEAELTIEPRVTFRPRGGELVYWEPMFGGLEED